MFLTVLLLREKNVRAIHVAEHNPRNIHLKNKILPAREQTHKSSRETEETFVQQSSTILRPIKKVKSRETSSKLNWYKKGAV
jgi:hypothetical protein